MKIAIVHDWLTGMRGGERVLESFIKLFPESDLFTLLHKKDSVSPLIQEQLKGTSFLNYLPHVGRYYRYLLPVFPLATRILSEALRPYDLVISLSHAAAKNVRLSKFQYHLIYCFTPMRYIWDQASTYFGSATPLLYPLLATLRNWDKSGGNPNGRSKFIAISKFISARIRRFYGQDATVIYPPVRSEWLKERQDGAFGEAFLYAGALVSYKRPDLVVKAFNELGLPLWVVGRGELEDKLRGIAASNVKFLGALPDNELAIYYRDCRALVFPAVEDFGIIPVEVMASGRPVIGINKGGVRESVINGESGLLLPRELSVSSLKDGIMHFIKCEASFTKSACILRSKFFSEERFFLKMKLAVSELMDSKGC